MEYVFTDINEAFPIVWHRMWDNDGVIIEPTRNGPVRRSIYPVTTIFKQPRKRVLMSKLRDCNPFFHLFESIWMLAGRNEVAWLAKFNKRMLTYSDDGLTLVGAYGYRWKGVLSTVIHRLRNDPQTRRAYIPLFWTDDCFRDGKDTPCNTGISFYIRDGYLLDMTVFNRSNDMIWGAYGANVVHFSFLQEYVAAAVDAEVGFYAQISSNFHLYTDFDITKRLVGKIDPAPDNPYETDPLVSCSPTLIINDHAGIRNWQGDAAYFMDIYTMAQDPKTADKEWQSPFFAKIAVPMYHVWHAHVQEKDPVKALSLLDKIEATDWRLSARQWIENRLEARGYAAIPKANAS
jgi:hypothetical protein